MGSMSGKGRVERLANASVVDTRISQNIDWREIDSASSAASISPSKMHHVHFFLQQHHHSSNKLITTSKPCLKPHTNMKSALRQKAVISLGVVLFQYLHTFTQAQPNTVGCPDFRETAEGEYQPTHPIDIKYPVQDIDSASSLPSAHLQLSAALPYLIHPHHLQNSSHRPIPIPIPIPVPVPALNNAQQQCLLQRHHRHKPHRHDIKRHQTLASIHPINQHGLTHSQIRCCLLPLLPFFRRTVFVTCTQHPSNSRIRLEHGSSIVTRGNSWLG